MISRLRAALAAPAIALALSLFAGALLIAAAGKNPLAVYAELLAGTLGSWYGIGQAISKATPLLFTGLSVAVAFRAGLFNIGAEGQMVMGGLAAALAGLAFPSAPSIVLLPLGILAAAAGGAATAAVPGLLRSARGVHEVISTLMINFIALAIAGAVISRTAVAATVHTEALPFAARLPRLADLLRPVGLGDALAASPASAAFLLGLAAAAVSGFVLFRTVAGYEMRAVGGNPQAAATSGIPVRATILRTMLFSGALAGMGSVGFVLGHKYYYETGFSSGAGFTGIAVALLGRNHPGGVVIAALLFGVLSQGGLVINGEVPSEIVNVLQALIILFLICSMTVLDARAKRAAVPV